MQKGHLSVTMFHCQRHPNVSSILIKANVYNLFEVLLDVLYDFMTL